MVSRVELGLTFSPDMNIALVSSIQAEVVFMCSLKYCLHLQPRLFHSFLAAFLSFSIIGGIPSYSD